MVVVFNNLHCNCIASMLARYLPCSHINLRLTLPLKSSSITLLPVRFLFRDKKERRKELWDEAKKGYFNDFHEFRKNRGKVSEAPNHLLSKKESVRFPVIHCQSLDGSSVILPSTKKVSLVLLSLRGFGMKACDEYRTYFLSEFSDSTNSAVVYDLSVVEQMPYRLMKGMFYRNLKRHIPTDRHSRFLFYSNKFSVEREILGIHNSIVGYCFLLDTEGKIRWRAHAEPTTTELESLLKCTKLLL